MYLGCLFSFSRATVAAATLVSRLSCAIMIGEQGAVTVVFTFVVAVVPNFQIYDESW